MQTFHVIYNVKCEKQLSACERHMRTGSQHGWSYTWIYLNT